MSRQGSKRGKLRKQYCPEPEELSKQQDATTAKEKGQKEA
jgi:hypothetical protein